MLLWYKCSQCSLQETREHDIFYTTINKANSVALNKKNAMEHIKLGDRVHRDQSGQCIMQMKLVLVSCLWHVRSATLHIFRNVLL